MLTAQRSGQPRPSTPKPHLLLSVRDLTSRFFLPSGVVHAVEQISFDLESGESLGLVGESGSGKSATVMSLLGLLPAPGRIVGGEVMFEGRDLLDLSQQEMRRLRGLRISLIPQNPGSALNPVLTIGWQMLEALKAHQEISRGEARDRIVEALDIVGIPDSRSQLERYPHEFSGGMKQRILIAMGVLNRPALLVADEPTTALDTTTQAKVLELMSDLVDSLDMALLIITHNMGVIASVCDQVAVMYAGQIVEHGPTRDLFRTPLHPYTELLLKSTPRLDHERPARVGVERKLLDSLGPSVGCSFRNRCPLAEPRCVEAPPHFQATPTRSVRCWVAQDAASGRSGSSQAPPAQGTERSPG